MCSPSKKQKPPKMSHEDALANLFVPWDEKEDDEKTSDSGEDDDDLPF